MSNINPESIALAQGVLSDILQRIGVAGTISARLSEFRGREVIAFNIKTDDANLLIGSAGEHLMALQYLARILFKKKYGLDIYFIVDVNNYKSDKEDKLKSLARSAALKVRRTKEPAVLYPMASYDRWVIHNFLAEENDLKTESQGLEPERKVIIKLAK